MAVHMMTPEACVGPVRSHSEPNTISFSLAAADRAMDNPATMARAAAAIPYRFMFFPPVRLCSVGVWPCPEVSACPQPKSVQPLRLGDEEQNDEDPEDRQPKVWDDRQQI